MPGKHATAASRAAAGLCVLAMLLYGARPWYCDGKIIGFWIHVQTFKNGAERRRYKRLSELSLEDFQ